MVFAREQEITFARDSPDSMSHSMIYLACHINLNLYKGNNLLRLGQIRINFTPFPSITAVSFELHLPHPPRRKTPPSPPRMGSIANILQQLNTIALPYLLLLSQSGTIFYHKAGL